MNVHTAFMIAAALAPAHGSSQKMSCEKLQRKGTELVRIHQNVDKREVKRRIRIVAEELGADPKLFLLWAERESSFEPGALHVQDADIRANTKSWQRERRRHSFGYPDAVLNSRMPVIGMRGGIPAFTLGYGMYGMNATLHWHRWDPAQKPEALCSELGIRATVLAIWAARRYQRECRRVQRLGNYEDINRRFGSGHCRVNKRRRRLAVDFRRRAKRWGLAPRRFAHLGYAYPEGETDREELIATLLSKIGRK